MTRAEEQGHDPLHVLWAALGAPGPDAPMDRAGRCARCGTETGQASRVKVVVSDKFTGWEDYTQATDPLWCVPCTWAHTAIEVRVKAWLIRAGDAVEATAEVLAAELDKPLSAHVALVVPLSRQKHILPAARWGHVTVDDRVLVWGPQEAHRFTVLRWLRGLGFSEASLTLPVPRFEQLMTLPAADMQHVMVRWEALSAWRHDSAYLKVACKAARTSTADVPVGAER